MESLFKNMDFPVKHWAAFPRHFPSPFPVDSAAFIHEKDHWIRHPFNSCNFSLILRGRGEFHRQGKIWPVQAPCVITQWPGEHVEYGPFLPGETWDEFYLIYGKSLFPALKKARLVDPDLPVWPIHDLSAVTHQIGELLAISQSSHPESLADRFDRICERLVLETRIVPPGGRPGLMQKIAAELERDPAAPLDLRALASRHGLSESSFRRQWAEVVPAPPHRYLLELRIRKACRLLAESKHPVREIAGLCGFEDELYFSRRFRLQMKMSPRGYRRIHQIRRPA